MRTFTEMTQNEIDIDRVIEKVDRDVFNNTCEHLTSEQSNVLKETAKGLNYKQISEKYSYSESYLRRNIGPNLWKRLSQAFGEEVNKRNCQHFLEKQSKLLISDRKLREKNWKDKHRLKRQKNSQPIPESVVSTVTALFFNLERATIYENDKVDKLREKQERKKCKWESFGEFSVKSYNEFLKISSINDRHESIKGEIES